MAALNAKKLRPAGEGTKVERGTVSLDVIVNVFMINPAIDYSSCTAYKPRPLAFINCVLLIFSILIYVTFQCYR